MNDRYLFKAKNFATGNWHKGFLVDVSGDKCTILENGSYWACNSETLCQCTSLKDENGKLIWENDVLMCNDNPKDLVKAVFGEFAVIDVDSLAEIDRVIGWHYEVISTDRISKCKPFCLSMPLTDFYINICDMKVLRSVFDNPELLEVE